jgi:divalent metal cation (Fe/Co/Zn/Cd) transporter
MLVEAVVALGSGIAAHSLSLIAFGADSLIELASAGVLLWRLNVEIRRGAEFSETAEHQASRIAGVLLLWLLAKSKIRIADQIGSRALRADAVESITCGYLSGVVVIGLLVQLLMPGWWWVDSAASLVIVALLVKEGREGWQGEDSD